MGNKFDSITYIRRKTESPNLFDCFEMKKVILLISFFKFLKSTVYAKEDDSKEEECKIFPKDSQLWSYDDETNILRNKNNGWVYLDKTWKIPTLNNLEGGYIEEISSGKVLGLKDDAYHNGTEVVLENKKEASEKLQIWIRTWWWNGTDNSFFTL